MGVFGTYFTHVQSCNVTRVQIATEWTASVHILHMSKLISWAFWWARSRKSAVCLMAQVAPGQGSAGGAKTHPSQIDKALFWTFWTFWTVWAKFKRFADGGISQRSAVAGGIVQRSAVAGGFVRSRRTAESAKDPRRLAESRPLAADGGNSHRFAAAGGNHFCARDAPPLRFALGCLRSHWMTTRQVTQQELHIEEPCHITAHGGSLKIFQSHSC